MNRNDQIYETIQAPHTYATHLRLTRRGFSKTECLAPLGSRLDTAIMEFKNCFRAHTGKGWEDRLDGSAPSPRRDEEGNIQPPHQSWFWFESEKVSALAGLFKDTKE